MKLEILKTCLLIVDMVLLSFNILLEVNKRIRNGK
jgi:hypothetical protein